jgi:hypothetical protein
MRTGTKKKPAAHEKIVSSTPEIVQLVGPQAERAAMQPTRYAYEPPIAARGLQSVTLDLHRLVPFHFEKKAPVKN